MSLKKVNYKDLEGRYKVVFLPEEESEDNAAIGIPIGPPDLTELGLPAEMEVRLNNELFHRGILTPQDALKKRSEVMAAIQSVVKLDAERVVTIYAGAEYRNTKKETVKTVEPTKNQNSRRAYRNRR